MNLSSLLLVVSGEWPPSDWQNPAVTPHHSLRAIKLLFILKRIIYLGLEVTAISAISKTKQSQRKKKKKKRKKKPSIFSNLSRFKKKQKVTGVFADWVIMQLNHFDLQLHLCPWRSNAAAEQREMEAD